MLPEDVSSSDFNNIFKNGENTKGAGLLERGLANYVDDKCWTEGKKKKEGEVKKQQLKCRRKINKIQ